MTLFLSIILWAVMLPVLPIMYFMQKNECKPKKNIVAGVTLPYEAQRNEEVLALLARYGRELKRMCWVMLAAVIPGLFFRSVGLFMIYYMAWIIALCAAFAVPYIRCNKALRRLKEARGWRRAEDAPQVVSDLTAAAEEMRWLSPWWFLPAFLIGLVPLAFEREVWWAWTICAALVPAFYLCYRHLYRNRAEVVDADSQRTMALTRIWRYNWGKVWLVTAWATGLFNVLLWLTLDHVWLCMGVCLLYGAVTVAEAVGIEFRVRRLQEKLTADSGQGFYVDEDDLWIWGMLYYNPNDARLRVNARVGVGTTANLARRPAQVIMALVLALLLACPLIGVWIMGMERAPVELAVTESALEGSHYGGTWSVALDDIAEVCILEECPRLRRISGSGLDNALTGQYNADGWGRVTCCIDPRTGPWLLVRQRDGRLFLFGSSEAGAAEAVAARLG